MMSTSATHASVSVRIAMTALARSSALPPWVRVGCLAWAKADPAGHARLGTGQLRETLGLSAQQTSDALARARRYGWVDPESNARCVVLPGHGNGPCEERHP